MLYHQSVKERNAPEPDYEEDRQKMAHSFLQKDVETAFA